MSDYDHIEKVLAEIIVEVTGEPRIGRFERTVAKSALARLRECGMALAERLEPQGEPSDADADMATRGLDHLARNAESPAVRTDCALGRDTIRRLLNERGAALEVMNQHRCGEQAEAAYRRAVRAESRAQGERSDVKVLEDSWRCIQEHPDAPYCAGTIHDSGDGTRWVEVDGFSDSLAVLELRDERDSLKMLRETLCAARAWLLAPLRSESDDRHAERIGRLIDEIDRQRPLGSDGKHGDLHTPTCGCEDR